QRRPITPKYLRCFGLSAGRAVREVLARGGCCDCLYLALANYSTHKPPRSRIGWSRTSASTCTLPRPAHPGSTVYHLFRFLQCKIHFSPQVQHSLRPARPEQLRLYYRREAIQKLFLIFIEDNVIIDPCPHHLISPYLDPLVDVGVLRPCR